MHPNASACFKPVLSGFLTAFSMAVVVVATAPLTSSPAAAQSAGRPAMANDNSWQFTVGGGVVSRPAYPGSGKTEVDFVPLLSASQGRFMAGALPGSGIPVGVGAFLIAEPQLRLGVGIGGGFSKPRVAGDYPRLRGLGDIDNTLRGSIFGSYNTPGPAGLTLRGSVQTDLGGKKQGTLATLDLEGRAALTDQFSISAGPGVTWADSTYSQTFFGINAAQSAASNRPMYRANSGINSVRFTVGANYQLTANWGVRAFVTAARLQGDAADSPITEKRSQNSAGVFVSYRF